eukprot:3732860-Alexandrium_andersonii.AAC.1
MCIRDSCYTCQGIRQSGKGGHGTGKERATARVEPKAKGGEEGTDEKGAKEITPCIAANGRHEQQSTRTEGKNRIDRRLTYTDK